ncbi:MAG: TonB-dependent receptor family protein [Muribaculaceae bacterium]|nr:TonB-dependent receptor family protein [Muribaculaceae bacterium]
MNKLLKAIVLMAMLPMSLCGQVLSDSTAIDSIADYWDKVLELNEVVVVGHRTVLKQSPDRIVYLTKNDNFAKGLNGIEVLDRIPRVSVVNDLVTVAGKSSVRYIVDGRLLEMSDNAIAMQLKNLQASGIEKIELLTTPPAKYAAGANVAFISITTRNESLGTRGNVWANGNLRESFNYMLGGNLSHTTRKVELSADASWNDIKGINDLDRTYTFDDYIKTSNRSTHFNNGSLGINGLFKYKFSEKLCAGAIANFSTNRLKSELNDVTVDRDIVFNSYNHSPARPNYALTLTVFSDWQLDTKGKMLSFTYNYFNHSGKSFSEVITSCAGNETRLANKGHNKYHIHSAKIDGILPFDALKMETGVAFTSIGNNTALEVSNHDAGEWISDPSQSNRFNYDENTVAAYMSAEKNFTDSFFGKLGLRYEHTNVKGLQSIGNERHNNRYSYYFPSLNLSWNSQSAGRFSISYSTGITRPNFADLNPFHYYTTTSDYVSGNPDLKPSVVHNAEINYSFKGLYAVIYNSYNHNSIGYVTRFNENGSQQTIPENCFNSNKTGLYAAYNRLLFDWWNMNVGGEIFHTYARSKIADFKDLDESGWSGKLEVNTTFMLNRKNNLIFNLRFSHYFPYNERMVNYESMSLVSCELRYMLLENKLTLIASLSDPFGWNITKSTAHYKDYSVFSRNNIHSHSVQFRISYSFGGKKVNNVYRDSKERESTRSN